MTTNLKTDTKLNIITTTFKKCFYKSYFTILKGGFQEPFYKAPKDGVIGEIRFRENFLNSALHEIAHWCIAGKERLTKDDFGYWYVPDGRTPEQQIDFFSVEIKPQALEKYFSLLIGTPFNISLDNLNCEPKHSLCYKDKQFLNKNVKNFQQSLEKQYKIYLQGGLPTRARVFAKHLKKFSL